jgi:hypothetical protein
MKRHQIIISVILISALIVLWQRHSPKINDWLIDWNLDSIAPVALLIQKFELTVFRNDFEKKGFVVDGLVRKWQLPIGVQLRNKESKKFKAHIENTLNILSRLSGLDIHIHNGVKRKRALLDIYIAAPSRVESILLFYDIGKSNVYMFDAAACQAVTFTNSIVTDRGLIIIVDTLGEKKIRHCIIEEITQVLGLDADSDILQPSIMSDTTPLIDRLPMNDKIMVRTLYDIRLKPGMTRDEAMPIVAKIIPELVAAVKERGEEALYQ